MRKQIIHIILSSVICVTGVTQAQDNPTKDGMFLHIKSGIEDPHQILMPLTLAGMMAETNDVVLFFDVKGYQVIVKDAPDLEYSGFKGSHELIRGLINKRVKIYACPLCLNAAGLTKDDLMPGIEIMQKEVFFGFTEGRIITLDY